MEEGNPFATVQQLAGAYCASRCLHAVADLGIADRLDDSPMTAAELAGPAGADPDALGRVLRVLASHGIFEQRGEHFGHSPASRLLRTDHPQSMRALAQMLGNSINWASFGALGHSIKTGGPAAETVLPGGVWAHFASNAEESRVFNAAMAGKAHAHVAAILAAYDFSPFRVIGDIGGGRGHLLRAILETAPKARGVLFDLPHVAAEAASEASDRIECRGGDFFKDALPACDLYLLMEVIHDWSDADSLAILEAVRRAAPEGATVLLLESIVPDSPAPHWSKTLDILMLTLLGGRQRTQKEYASLLGDAGFSFTREIETPAGISIVEATATHPAVAKG
jgi:hypothetical protein